MMFLLQGIFSGKRIELVFENLITYYITNVYIPTSVMLVIGYSTFFFPLNDYNDRIMVAITSLLVESSLFSQVGLIQWLIIRNIFTFLNFRSALLYRKLPTSKWLICGSCSAFVFCFWWLYPSFISIFTR